MRRNLVFWATIVIAAAALVASGILLVDYVRGPVYCDVDGGCQAIKATAFAYPLGIPMPALGIAGLLGLGLAALVPGSTARFVQAAFGVAAGAAGVLLLVVQGSMGVFCPFCVVVDTSSILLGIASTVRMIAAWDPPGGRLRPGVAVSALVLAVVLPIAVGFRLKPHERPAEAYVTPGLVERAIQEAGGKVTVVDFVDFECPYCRMTHAELAPLLAARKSEVKVVRKQVPLKIHPHALDAAKAACCAEKLGKSDEYADALFRTPVEELTTEGCEARAKELGLDVDAFRACVKDPATQARIDHDREEFKAANGRALPTIWIDETRLQGAQDRATLSAALDKAIRARGLSL